eukprot:TRINITY_DN3467_c0_g1_i1.p1 TRINITY_DN3467_c0_g1~~TRINITY_DN3467_c0_g1_i1.p1  ORF type:complete len:648 (+),score=67.02 TRINITY_DN3467_c0_g1_i1:243-1946(+)
MDTEGTEDILIEYTNQQTHFKLFEIIWHFCEVFLVSTYDIITPQIVAWMQMHSREISLAFMGKVPRVATVKEFASFGQGRSREIHQEYWPTVFHFLILGQLDHARELLRIHPDNPAMRNRRLNRSDEEAAQADLFHVLDALLDSMPKLYIGFPVAEYIVTWEKWQNDCRIFQERLTPYDIDGHFCDMLGLLAGDEMLLRKYTTSWIELFVAVLLYKHPGAGKRNGELQRLSEHCAKAKPKKRRQTSGLDEILFGIIQQDRVSVVTQCDNALGNWFSAHLADILSVNVPPTDAFRMKLSSTAGEQNLHCDLREFYVLNYIMYLMTRPSLWRIAVDYCSTCPEYGKHYMAEIIQRQDLRTEKKARKLLRVCKRYALVEVGHSIERSMGMKRYKEGRYGACMQWFIRAGSPEQFNDVVNKLADDCFHGRLHGANETLSSAFDGLLQGAEPLPHGVLFLSVFLNLRSFWKRKDYASVAKGTNKLVGGKLAPQRFWLALLADIVPLLESSADLFSLDEVYALLHSFQELSLSTESLRPQLPFSSVAQTPSLQLSQVRLALTRLLSKKIALSV